MVQHCIILGFLVFFSGQFGFVSTQNVCKTFGSGVMQTFNATMFHVKSTCPIMLTHFSHAGVDCFISVQRGPSGVMKKVEILVNKIATIIQDGILTVEGNSISLPYDHTYQNVYTFGIYTRLTSKVLPLSVTWYSLPEGVTSVWVQLDRPLVNGMTGMCGRINSSETRAQLLDSNVIHDETCVTSDSQPVVDKTCSEFKSYARQCLGKRLYIFDQLCKLNMYINVHASVKCSFYEEFIHPCNNSYTLQTKLRNTTSCKEHQCPGDLQYKDQGAAFPPTCSNPELQTEFRTATCLPRNGLVLNDRVEGYHSVKVEDCPCVHRGIIYDPGQKRSSKCQSCECIKGKWNCSPNTCVTPCVIEGWFVNTFDGKQYSLPGKCTYVAAMGLNWTITIKFSDMTIEEIDLDVYQERYIFSLNSVQLREKKITATELSQTAHATVYWQSSMFVKVQTSFGMKMHIQVSPEVQLYLYMPKNVTTTGLCGSNNNNTEDDFTTSSGIVENSAQLFALSWAIGDCRSSVHVCINTDNEIFAEDKCSQLTNTSGIFSQCHDYVPVHTYFSACVQKTCQATSRLQEPVCVSLGNYAKACTTQGINIGDWRAETGCTYSCDGNLRFDYHMQACNRTCRSLSGPDPTCDMDIDDPVEGCGCESGTHLNTQLNCSPRSLCDCTYPGGTTPPGPVVIDGRQCICENGILQCSDACDCPHGQICVHCAQVPVNTMQRTCASLSKPSNSDESCISGCYCPKGQFADHNGSCVTQENCTCEFSGMVYASGESVESNCKTCTCRGGQWDCRGDPCPGVCEVFGNGQYKTFDSNWYRFDGHCQYTLVEDTTGLFSINVESVPCCDEALTCSRSISVKLKDEVTLILCDMNVTQRFLNGWGIEAQSLYSVHTVGLYIIISVPQLGLNVIWDKQTKVKIELQAYWNGKVRGLCGDFDGKLMNDLLTSSSTVVFSTLEFGNSWKTAVPPCSDVTEEQFPCERHSYCAAWAQRRCMILHSDTFKPCHLKVDPTPYYQACVLESCSCDFEGKFLGFCTAVAAYADACTTQNVCIKWRTPDLCPVYCDYFNEEGQYSWHYEACPRQIKTCGKNNKFSGKLEGCYPQCPNEMPYYDENRRICSSLDSCTCYFNNTVLEPGAKVTTPNECCDCIKGQMICDVCFPTSFTTTKGTSKITSVPNTTTLPKTITPLTTTYTPNIALTLTTLNIQTGKISTAPIPGSQGINYTFTTPGTTTTKTTEEPTSTTLLTTTTTVTPITTTKTSTPDITTEELTSTTPLTTTTTATPITTTKTSTTEITTEEPTSTTPLTKTKTETPITTSTSEFTTEEPTSTTLLTTTATSITTTKTSTTEITTEEPTSTTPLTTTTTETPITTTKTSTPEITTEELTSTTPLTTTTTATLITTTKTSSTEITTEEPTSTTPLTKTKTETPITTSTSEFTTEEPTSTTLLTTTATSITTTKTSTTEITTEEPTSTTPLNTTTTETPITTSTSEYTTEEPTSTTLLTTTTTSITTTKTSTPEVTTEEPTSTTPLTTTTTESPITTTKTSTPEITTEEPTSTTPLTTTTTETPITTTKTSTPEITTEEPTSTTPLTTTATPTTPSKTSHSEITTEEPTSTTALTTTETPITTTKTSTPEITTEEATSTTQLTTTETPMTTTSTQEITSEEPTSTTTLTTTPEITTEEPTTTTQLSTTGKPITTTTSTPEFTTEEPTSTTQLTTTTTETPITTTTISTSEITTEEPTSTTTLTTTTTETPRTTTKTSTPEITSEVSTTKLTTIITKTPVTRITTLTPEITSEKYKTITPSPTTANTPVTASTIPTTTAHKTVCKDLNRNQTWPEGFEWTEDCFTKTCKNGVIELRPLICPTPVIPVCPRGMPKLKKDKQGCCDTWQCDCQCDVFGDPHYMSFAGQDFVFLENCTYILVEERTPTHQLRISVDNYYCEPSASCARGIIVQYQNNTVILQVLEVPDDISILQTTLNQVTIKPPYQAHGLRFESTDAEVYIYIEEIRSYIFLSVWNTLQINLAMEHFIHNTQGQCGVCGGPSCTRRDGIVEREDCCDKTAYEWIEDDPLKPYCQQARRHVPCYTDNNKTTTTTISSATTTTTTSCTAPLCDLLRHQVFSECSGEIDVEKLVSSCKFDYCVAQKNSSVCSPLERLADQCKKMGICAAWRNLSHGICDIACPEGMIFDECRSTPSDFCQGGVRVPGTTLDSMRSGCFCPDKQLLADTHKKICVSECTNCKGPLGEPMPVGAIWESNCHMCTCNNQTLTEECWPKPPLPTSTCSPGSALIFDCCNNQICVEQTCEYNGTKYKVGETWKEPKSPCLIYRCTSEGTEIEQSVCPQQFCLEELRVWDEHHCCYSCNTTCGVRLSKMTVENCTQEVMLPTCEGNCASGSLWVTSGKDLRLEHNQFSCREKDYEIRQISLVCSGATATQYTYKHITSCECQRKA